MTKTSRKSLVGVELTEELKKLLQFAAEEISKETSDVPSMEEDADARSVVQSALRPHSYSEAVHLLQEYNIASIGSAAKSTAVPIRTLRALQTVAKASENSALREAFAASKPSTRLMFKQESRPVRSASAERKYQNRMDRLRLQHESHRYAMLTTNIGKTVQDDDITAKSMTYAASIGLNMIIAPLSFGAFMYHFGGSLLDYIWPNLSTGPGGRKSVTPKILLGVVAGVGLLFVELLLFVIRTHTLEKAMRTKKRVSTAAVQPFGHYTARTSKTYRDRQ